jgi:hypothetical protein
MQAAWSATNLFLCKVQTMNVLLIYFMLNGLGVGFPHDRACISARLLPGATTQCGQRIRCAAGQLQNRLHQRRANRDLNQGSQWPTETRRSAT